jgi:hypothetical protein
MDVTGQFLKGLDFKSDFVAMSYREWQLQQVKQKPFNVVKRLKKIKQVDKLKKGS